MTEQAQRPSETPSDEEQRREQTLKSKRKIRTIQGEFWTRALMRELVFGDEVLSLDEYENTVNALTEQDVKDAAKLYLDEKNVVISVNDPASAK